MVKKKKFLVVADLHGRLESLFVAINRFKTGKYDYIIFLGDYVDSHNISNEDVVSTIIKVINLKREYPDKVICLIGNHDQQYIDYPGYTCSGFRKEMQKELTALFNENLDLFKIAFEYNKHLFIHAGISLRWYEAYYKDLVSNFKENIPLVHNTEEPSIATILNYSFHDLVKKPVICEVGSIRGGLPFDTGGPIWADKTELLQNPLREYHQIVGHNKVSRIEKITKFNGSHYNNTSITFCDVLSKDPFKFLELEL